MWLNDVRLILPDQVLEHAALCLEDGLIREIRNKLPDSTSGHDVDHALLTLPGMSVMPGIVDLHGDMLERDIEPRPGARFPIELALYELDKRMAATGITTAWAAVSFSWAKQDLRSQANAEAIIRTINAERDHLLVDFRVHARFEITNPETVAILEPLIHEKLVNLVSVMDHTPGQGQYANVPKYVDFMTRWLGFDPEAIGPDVIGRISTAIEVNVTKPRDWSIIESICTAALKLGIPVASHDDDTVEKVQHLAQMGVTISEFPVTLIAAQEARRLGMHVIMGAPNAYRGASNTGNLSAREAVQAGVVDILATDYFPAAPFQAALLLAAQGDVSLPESVNLVSRNPAQAMGLTDRGQIAVGQRADLILFDAADAHPRVRATLRQGLPIYWDGVMARYAEQQAFHFVNFGVTSDESA